MLYHLRCLLKALKIKEITWELCLVNSMVWLGQEKGTRLYCHFQGLLMSFFYQIKWMHSRGVPHIHILSAFDQNNKIHKGLERKSKSLLKILFGMLSHNKRRKSCSMNFLVQSVKIRSPKSSTNSNADVLYYSGKG